MLKWAEVVRILTFRAALDNEKLCEICVCCRKEDITPVGKPHFNNEAN